MGVSAFALPPHSDLTMHRVSIAGEILLKGAKFLEFFIPQQLEFTKTNLPLETLSYRKVTTDEFIRWTLVKHVVMLSARC